MLIGGLDVGTTGCKLTIYNNNGEFIHNEYIEYEVKRQNGEHEIKTQKQLQTMNYRYFTQRFELGKEYK